MKPICIYHGNCADGFGAAWVVRKALQHWDKEQPDFHAGVYQTPPPDVIDRDVIIVDFSYKYQQLLELARRARSILIIDHHKSAFEDLFQDDRPKTLKLHNVSLNFDMDRSGARMTWDWYFPQQEPPRLIDVIQDRDLWRFKLEGTREIQANIFSHPYDFEVWDKLMDMDLQAMRMEGAAIERKHFKDIHELLAVVQRTMVIGGHTVPVANLPYIHSSDAGHIMAKGNPFAACYWDTPDGRVFSLRSAEDGADVSEIAKQYGGGGHKNASGFKVPKDHPLAIA